MFKLSLLLALPCLLLTPACNSDDGDQMGDSYDDATLDTYRAALPSQALLAMPTPPDSGVQSLGEPALYPGASKDIVTGVNGAVTGMVSLLELVTSIPPTFYNSETKEFFWGPFENDDGFGWVGAYIKDAGEGADFRYQYAFLRGASNDLATLTPVIWGGANPDPTNEDHGSGITLWDFQANAAFEEANNPDAASLALDRGRFVAVYGRNPAEDNAQATVGIVLAVFRDFVPKDEPTNAPVDLDYFYGHYAGPEISISFLDFEFALDVSDPTDDVAEDVGVRMAFTDDGVGRAEADAAGGSLGEGQSFLATECWNAGQSRTYFSTQIMMDDAVHLGPFEDGTVSGCGLVFQSTLDELSIPSLQSVDPALLTALENVAENGIPQE